MAFTHGYASHEAADPSAAGPAPGKRTLTDGLPGRRGGGAAAAPTGAASASSPAAGNGLSSDVSFVDSLLGGPPGGGPTADWGERLGVDLSDVRVHDGPAAAARVDAHGARALADGSDIFLGEGERADDLELLGHELAHVAQTKHGAASGPHGKRDGDGAALEVDADRAGHALAHGHGPVVVAAAAPAVRAKESVPARKLRVLLRTLAAEAMALGADYNAGDDAQATAARCTQALVHMNVDLIQADALAQALTPEEQAALVSSARFLVDRAGQLAAGRAGAKPTVLQIKALLEAWVGQKLDGQAPIRRDSDGGERLEVTKGALADAQTAVAAAVAGSKAGAAGTRDQPADTDAELGLSRLAAAHHAMRQGALGSDDEDVARRTELQKAVGALTADCRVLISRYPKGARVRELRVRLSDVREQVFLDCLIADDMATLLGDEAMAARGYTDAQAARFDAAAELWREALRAQFAFQELAAEEIREESKVVDPPKKPPLWQTLALAAVKSATGGAVGLLIDLGTDYAMGSDDELDKVKGGGAAKAFKSVLGDAIKGAAGALIDEAFTLAEADGGMLGGGRDGTAEVGGGGASTDGKTAFFAAQIRALVIAGAKAQGEAIATIAALRGQPSFAADPEAAIKLVAGMAGNVTALEGPISDMQRAHTRAKFAAFLVGDTAVQDAAAVEMADKWDGSRRLEYVRNVAGMVSMQFRPGATPADPVTLESAWIKGVNKPMRDQLEQMKLAEMGVPMRARGIVAQGLTPSVAVVVSDQGYHHAEGPGAAHAWLLEKGDGDLEEAARKVLDEQLGATSLAEQGVKLQD